MDVAMDLTGGTVAVLLGAIAAYLMLIVAWYVLQAVAYWRIFTKAGEAGWKSLIPVYNLYVQYRICWNTGMFWTVFILGIAAAVFAIMGIPFISGILSVVNLLIGVVSLYKLSRAFGHGIPFTIGLYLLNPIFMLILGFDSSEYRGPQ